MITMTYFHSWTLRAADETQSLVPHAGNLRPQDATWELTLSMWLDGNVVSQESAFYAGTFLCVFCVRPRDQDEDVRSDEDVDDEELSLTRNDLKQALKTRIGGQHTNKEAKTTPPAGGKTTHEEHSGQGISLAQRTWRIRDDAKQTECVSPLISKEHAQEAIKSARQSHNQTASDDTAHAANANDGSVSSRFACSGDDVRKWKEDIKERRSEDGRLLLNALQYEMVERVADQVCVELRARTTNNYDDVQPLRWSLHGGPGTGKSHVIKIIQTEFFEQILQFKIAVEFHIVALQAVMADL